MPIGYLITTACVAAAAWAAVLQHRPRRSAPFRPSYVVGLWLNWPLITFVFLVASTALAIDQTGIASHWLWIGLGLCVVAAAALVVLRRVAQGTGPALERALDEGLGAGWRDSVDADLARRLRRRPSLSRILLAPLSSRRRSVERIANIRYGPARRTNALDVYRARSGRRSRPVLVHFHPIFGSKRVGTRYLFHRLAGEGWICIGANYRDADDVKKAIGWVREHSPEYGGDATAIFVAGSSLGAHLASQAAFTDASIAGLICLYGYYGASVPTTAAPPCFVAHGDRDSLVIVDDARRFVEHVRAASANPVVYAELPGAQHGFDLFRSRRLDTVVDAIEAFVSHIRAAQPSS
jgi:acetyl esterase/lipase